MISVIIPTYNSKKHLKECLQAILNQSITRSKYEVIVVDDGSTDKSEKIIDKQLIRYIVQDHKGPASARNFGVRKARGEIIVFLDADCIPFHNFLEQIEKSFSNPEIVGIKGFYRTKQVGKIAKFAQIEYEYKYKKVLKEKFIDFIDTFAAAYRKEIFIKEGGFDTSFTIASGEDIDFSYRLSEKGYKLISNSQVLVYHNHPNNFTKYLSRKFKIGFWRALLYKKHTQKIFRDSHTPLSLKIQVLIILLIFILFPFLFIDKAAFFVLFSLIAIYLITTSKFLLFCFNKNAKMGNVVLPILISRDVAISVGLLGGILSLLTNHKH